MPKVPIPRPPQPADDAWWTTFYDDTIADVLLERRDADAVMDALVELTGLHQGGHVFDQCCGTGVLSAAFAARGYAVTGVDAVASYIDRARARCRAIDVPGVCPETRFRAQDARLPFADEPFAHLAINWWTSFGYSDDSGNEEMLRAAHAALLPGGLFVLDIANPLRLVSAFRPSSIEHRDLPGGRVTLLRESTLDAEAMHTRSTWTTIHPDGTRTTRHSCIQLYTPRELASMCQRVGFDTPRFFGAVSRQAGFGPFTVDSDRLVLLARRR